MQNLLSEDFISRIEEYKGGKERLEELSKNIELGYIITRIIGGFGAEMEGMHEVKRGGPQGCTRANRTSGDESRDQHSAAL